MRVLEASSGKAAAGHMQRTAKCASLDSSNYLKAQLTSADRLSIERTINNICNIVVSDRLGRLFRLRAVG